MRNTLALLAGAGAAFASWAPPADTDCPEEQAASSSYAAPEYSGVPAQYSSAPAAYSSVPEPASSAAPSGYPSYQSSPASSSYEAPAVVTNTKTVTTTYCPCAGPTHTPGEVYTTVTEVEKTSLCPFEKSYSWGDVWTSTYTSYSTSTYTDTITTTITVPVEPTGGASGYPSGGAGGYPSGSAPGGYPGGSASGYPSGGVGGYPGGSSAGAYPSGSSAGAYPSGSGYPSGGPGGYGSSSVSAYPTASYPSSSGIWGSGTASAGTGTAAPTCAKPKPTGKCTPCEDQPGNDKFCGYDIHDNWYDVAPKTCKTVEYHWSIVNTTVAPDGRERMALLVDDGSGPSLPGPMIHASWGDTVVVHLTNNLPKDGRNGTTLHFHGIRQNGTNEMDGVPSITQCPLAPGETQTYTWQATSYGSSWWHAHYALQTYEGIFGPMLIDGPVLDESDADAVDQFVMLQDWSEQTVDEKYYPSMVVGGPSSGPQTLDNILVNGMGVWENGGKPWGMQVEAGKKYRLRVVNSAIQSTFKFHIDGHKFKVIAADFTPIQSYETDMISINIGQRYDLILEANQEPGNYWIRTDNQQPCGIMQVPVAQGVLSYTGAPAGTPTSQNLPPYPPNCDDEPYASLVPIVPWNAGAAGSTTLHETNIIGPNNGNPNLFKWTLSGTTFVAQWEDPTLYSIYEGNGVPDYSGNLAIEVPNLGEWVYIIMDSPIPLPHPIHLHGHDFLVLAQGKGAYSSSVPLQLENPPRRDTAVMPGDPAAGQPGYLVIAYYTSSPGVWLLHCHIGWHNSMGFALQIIENLEGIKETVNDGCQMEDVCKSWKAYANAYDVFTDGIDSGV